MASLQSFFRDDIHGHRYVSSPQNKRIEAWWSHFRRSRITWWINFFKDLEEQEVLNQANELQSECIWFTFAPLSQADLDYVKEHWNTHYIRKSRYDTVSGRPDSLYFLPEISGGTADILFCLWRSTTWIMHKHMLLTVTIKMNFRSTFSTSWRPVGCKHQQTGEKD